MQKKVVIFELPKNTAVAETELGKLLPKMVTSSPSLADVGLINVILGFALAAKLINKRKNNAITHLICIYRIVLIECFKGNKYNVAHSYLLLGLISDSIGLISVLRLNTNNNTRVKTS